MELLIMAISVFTNLWAVKLKLEKKHYSDAILDGAIFIILMMVFAGTVSGLNIATTASSIFSLYLYFSPPTKMLKSIKEDVKEQIKDIEPAVSTGSTKKKKIVLKYKT